MSANDMPQITTVVKTIKLHIHVSQSEVPLLEELTSKYSEACTKLSEYVFGHGFPLNFMVLQDAMYQNVRESFGLKSQMTISACKTVTARYKTVQEQLAQKPYKWLDEHNKPHYEARTLEWLWKPIQFRRPQADLVRNRDYSFVTNKKTGEVKLSLNTLSKRVKVGFDVPDCFEQYFDGSWQFGTGKLVSLLGEWYFHIPASKEIDKSFDREKPSHVVGIDRGLRFILASYDEKGKSIFVSGKNVMRTRQKFNDVRAELQTKGTKAAKRRLKKLAGRENRWMNDTNHRLSKTLVDTYGSGTLFVIEDLKGVSFSEGTLKNRSNGGRNELRSWTFYQLEQFLSYKAAASGSFVLKVPADYTSQRCPKCGRILKENRHHGTHTYICDGCGYQSNDDRIGAMNLQLLGTQYVSGDEHPRIRKSE